MTQTYPRYEVWGLDDTPSDMDCGNPHHLEDHVHFDEAIKAARECQTHGRAAWVQDKDTGETLWPIPMSQRLR